MVHRAKESPTDKNKPNKWHHWHHIWHHMPPTPASKNFPDFCPVVLIWCLLVSIL
jgi:hypothetical protein